MGLISPRDFFLIPKKPLILASTSPIRKALLARLQVPFKVVSPTVDETPRAGEHPKTLVKRLAIEKALSVGRHLKEGRVIGADQVAALGGMIFGKPGNFQVAKEYLLKMSGQQVTFFSGLCVYDVNSEKIRACVEIYSVWFRSLSETMICEYLHFERPYSIAAGFKSEGLGPALVKKFSGKDPSSLLGLPLIRLCQFLEIFRHPPRKRGDVTLSCQATLAPAQAGGKLASRHLVMPAKAGIQNS